MNALLALWLSTATPIVLDDAHPTMLDGMWELSKEDSDMATQWTPVRVPGSLTFQGIHVDGVVRMRRTVTLPPTWGQQDAALRMPMTANAYDVIVNGTVVGHLGRIGPHGELLQKDFRSSVFRVPFSVLRPQNVVEIRLRTFYGNGGALTSGVFFGPEVTVRIEHQNEVMKAAMLFALYMFAGLFHVVLYAGRRERHYLSFAGISFALASITAGIHTLGYTVTSSPDVNAYLVFIPLLVLSHLCVRFCNDFFQLRAHRWLHATCAWSSFAIVCSLLSTLWNPLYPIVERFVLPVSLLAIVVAYVRCWLWTVQAVRARVLGAIPVLVGMTVYVVSAVWELTWHADIVAQRADSFLGFAFFIACMVIALATRFAWLQRHADTGERDALTGCLTRHGFLHHADALLRPRTNGPLSTCILIDLDHFKRVNDNNGHAVGDAVLRAVGGALQKTLRGSDIMARWGGEEFLVLLPNQSVSTANDVAVRLQQAFQDMETQGQVVTASFGIAEQRLGETFDAWVERSDRALYAAKNAGRNCIRVDV
jgi:diguanylate cyclase (GGDEF)-like protein